MDARLGLAKAYIAVDRTDDTVSVLEEAMKIDPKRPGPYINLAKIYISRDGLEKAIEILEAGIINSGDASIKTLLDEIKPNAPKASVESGTYEQPFEVELISTQKDWKIYYTLDGTTPNKNSILYENPIKIVESKTVLKLLSISKMGILSDVAEYIYALEGSRQVVTDKSTEEPIITSVPEPADTPIPEPTGIPTLESTDDMPLPEPIPSATPQPTHTQTPNPVVTKERGNSVGNITNGGHAAVQGDWIYFCYYSDDLSEYGSLYKIRTDGTNRTKLTDDRSCDSINVIGDWIYYSNGGYSDELYKIRIDGTQRTKIADFNCNGGIMNIVGDWIYFIGNNGQLYKIHTDGTQYRPLDNALGKHWFINVVGDWIYYSNGDDKGKLYKIHIDEMVRKTKISDDSCQYINVVDDWVYYSNASDENRLYKIHTDGAEKIKLIDDSCAYINIERDWIYYSNLSDSGKLYKVQINGAGKLKLSDDSCRYINVVGDWIYYGDDDTINRYRIRTDGSDRQPVE